MNDIITNPGEKVKVIYVPEAINIRLYITPLVPVKSSSG